MPFIILCWHIAYSLMPISWNILNLPFSFIFLHCTPIDYECLLTSITERIISRLEMLLLSLREKQKPILNDKVIQQVKASQQYVQQIVADNKTVYGVNTGLAYWRIQKFLKKIQLLYNIRYCKAIVWEWEIVLPTEVAKIMLITKVHALAQGYSGVQLSTLERIIWHIENDIIPVVPEKGSVGASGDLAPLAHLFLPLIRLGEVDTLVDKTGKNKWKRSKNK